MKIFSKVDYGREIAAEYFENWDDPNIDEKYSFAIQ